MTAKIFPPTAGQQYSGYLTADVTSNAQMFYWFFEAANSSAPIILWLEGGPGFSGMFQVSSKLEKNSLNTFHRHQVTPKLTLRN